MDTNLNEPLLGKDNEDSHQEFDSSKIFNNEYNNVNRASEAYFKQNCESVNKMCQYFRSDLEKGLDSNNKNDLDWREKKWGNNHLPPEKENSILAHIIE